MNRVLFLLLSAVTGVFTANAADSLLYFEAQGVAGYSSAEGGTIYHSAHEHDAMQKNGVGFDYMKKFSGEYGDWGTGALQMRLVWDDADDKPQLQVYNAYLRVKTAPAYFWIGHNRFPYGLSAYWDTHADLLQPLSMSGFGFERDWGAGFSRDFANGDVSAAVTTGSGMGLKTKGNWAAAARAAYGVLSRDNYNIGVSFMGGKILDTMGYEIMDDNPDNTMLGGIDFAYNHDRFEHKAEFSLGRKSGTAAAAVFYRLGVNFLEENRLKLEGQYVRTKKKGVNTTELGFGTAYRINSDLTARALYQRRQEINDNRVVFQLYYYFLGRAR